jgi:ribose 5-phosphate isomerase B
MTPLSLVLASDHGGFDLKQTLKKKLKAAQISFEDLGPNAEERVDYPDYAVSVAEAVRSKEGTLGLLICGTGQGMAMSANKIPGIRAAVVGDTYSARMAREHNNANVLCLGGRVMGCELAWEILQTFLNADFAGGRHEDRLKKIQQIETKYSKES